MFDNLKRAVKKAEVERVLEELSQEGKLIVKEVGKMKVSPNHKHYRGQRTKFPSQVYMHSQEEFCQSSCNIEGQRELLIGTTRSFFNHSKVVFR